MVGRVYSGSSFFRNVTQLVQACHSDKMEVPGSSPGVATKGDIAPSNFYVRVIPHITGSTMLTWPYQAKHTSFRFNASKNFPRSFSL